MAPWPPEKGYNGQTWSDSDGNFINSNGTWFRDSGALIGFLCGDCRYESVNTKNTGGTPDYDGSEILPSSTYDYSYDLMPGKNADDENYLSNGESGFQATRIFEIIGRDAMAEGNSTVTLEAVVVVVVVVVVATSFAGGRGSNNLKANKEAVGAHSTFARDNKGNIYKYETYEKTKTGHFNPTKRFDGGKPDGSHGAPHNGVETPHVQTKKRDQST